MVPEVKVENTLKLNLKNDIKSGAAYLDRCKIPRSTSSKNSSTHQNRLHFFGQHNRFACKGRARPLLGNKAAPANTQIIKTQKDKKGIKTIIQNPFHSYILL